MVQKIWLPDIFFGLSCCCQAIITNFYIFKCKMVLIKPFILHENRKCTFCDILSKKIFGDPEPPSLVWSSGSRCAADVRTIFQKSSPPYRQFLDPPLQLAAKKGQLEVKQKEAVKLINEGTESLTTALKKENQPTFLHSGHCLSLVIKC